MAFLISQLIFGEVNSISIPTDTIFIIFLLGIFTLIVYFFNKIISNETTQIAKATDCNCNIELEDHLKIDTKIPDQKNVEKPINKKINIIRSSKFMGIRSLAFFVMGGASLLGLQHMHKSYEGIHISRENIKIENQLKKFPLSIVNLNSLDKSQKNIKKINYIDPFINTIKKSKANHFSKIKDKQIENNFSF